MHVPAICIAGWSDSGKTTLIERLIPLLTARGLRVGVVKSNGPQNYTDWRRLDAMCAAPAAAWRTPQNGVYRLDGGFYGESGIFAPLPAYADTLRPV